MTIKLNIIVVSYNTKQMTLDCLSSIFQETDIKQSDVFVIDNASSDGSQESIKFSYPDINFISLTENVGFAKANNIAARSLTQDYLLLLNPDTVVLNSAIDKLLQFARSYDEAGIWGGRTLFADGTLNLASCWHKITAWSLFCRAYGLSRLFRNSSFFNPEAYGGWKRDSIRKVDIVSGCFFLIKRNLWECLGGFDERFFMYGEEADLCLRATKLGYSPMVTPNAEIVHYGGASEKSHASKLVKLLKAKMMLIDRHSHRYSKYLGFFLLALWPLNRYLLATVMELSNRSSEQHREWIKVWQLRHEWMRF